MPLPPLAVAVRFALSPIHNEVLLELIDNDNVGLLVLMLTCTLSVPEQPVVASVTDRVNVVVFESATVLVDAKLAFVTKLDGDQAYV